MSLNIHGNFNQLTSSIGTIKWLNTFDVISLSELKCNAQLNVPGFSTIRSLDGNAQDRRGGLVVLVKWRLVESIYNVDRQEDQVWFKLRSLPDLCIGACYIPPNDSPYFKNESFALIQTKVMTNRYVLLLGDLNVRISDLTTFDSAVVTYGINPDRCTNKHGYVMDNMCKNLTLTPINHAQINATKIKCDGNFTYRKSTNWISQIDWMFCTASYLPRVRGFTVNQSPTFTTDHASLELTISPEVISTDYLYERAQMLGKHNENVRRPKRLPTPRNVDELRFRALLPSPEVIIHGTPSPDLPDKIVEAMQGAAAEASFRTQHHNPQHWLNEADRWKKLLSLNDHKLLWQAIDWTGKVQDGDTSNEPPPDEEFAEFYHNLLNDGSTLIVPESNIFIPVLDNPITALEVFRAIQVQKISKAAGPDGLYPGLLRMLPDAWIPLLVIMFNEVFMGGYPQAWERSRTIMLFKKGDTRNPSNYRGISIMDALAGLYDRVLAARLSLWYIPDVSQAGAQAGRSCYEQVFSLRLFIDFAKKTKRTLYILFVDYEKAYDRVPRQKLINMLAEKGCGTTFISAITRSMMHTSTTVGSQSIPTTRGVRQGSSSSCPLFVFLIDYVTQQLNNLPQDSWLGSVHSMLFMDDTVLLATSRKQMEVKLQCLIRSAEEINMKMNPSKSQYITVNSTDKESFLCDRVEVKNVTCYTYLGCIISAETLPRQIAHEIKSRTKQTFKFSSFLKRNNQAPFSVKAKVWTSAFQSAILYGCESWLTNSKREIASLAVSTLKELLGVRQQTPNNLVIVEAGLPHIADIVESRQINFLRKLRAAPHFNNSPAQLAIQLANEVRSPASNYLAALPLVPSTRHYQSVKAAVSSNLGTRCTTYRQINPALTQHAVYTSQGITERERVAFSRLRLSSHHLRVETGRWARLPREQRLCSCQLQCVQDEEHVILSCPLSANMRVQYELSIDFTNFETFFNSPPVIARYVFNILKQIEN